MASESRISLASLPVANRQATLAAPTVLSAKTTFDSVDLAKYQGMELQSQAVITRKAAGASDTTKTVLIVVGVVAAGLIVTLLVITHGGKGILVGGNNMFAQ